MIKYFFNLLLILCYSPLMPFLLVKTYLKLVKIPRRWIGGVSSASYNIQQSLPPRSFQTRINKEKKSIKHMLKNLRLMVMYGIIRGNTHWECL